MKLIVSKEPVENLTSDYLVVKSLEQVDWGTVDVLIFHSTVDSSIETILNLTKARNEVPKKIFINKELNNLYYVLFQGMGADIYKEEDYLKDVEFLNYLIDNYNNTNLTIKSVDADIDKIAEYINELTTSNLELVVKYINSPVMQKNISTALVEVKNSTLQKQEQERQMVSFFEDALGIINDLKENYEKTGDKLREIEEYLEDVDTRKQGSDNKKFLFPTYKIPPKVSRVAYIRVLTPPMYLESFIQAYAHYVNNDLRKRCKVLIVAPLFKQVVIKYRGLPNISSESVRTVDLNSSDLFVTHEPTGEVLTKFFSSDVDLHIVIDYMYGDVLLKGIKVTQFNAIASWGDKDKYSLRSDTIITSIRGGADCVVIPSIPSYSANSPSVVAKLSKYSKAVRQSAEKNNTLSAYEKIDRKVFKN